MTGTHTPSVADVAAFPVPNDANVNGQSGMTLRDYFAGQALAGLVASPQIKPGTKNREYAGIAYALADAMLAARATSKEAQGNG